jgi:hypothetical protein
MKVQIVYSNALFYSMSRKVLLNFFGTNLDKFARAQIPANMGSDDDGTQNTGAVEGNVGTIDAAKVK